MILGLFGGLTFLLLLSLISFGGKLIAPANLMIGGFWLSSLWALMYSQKWGFQDDSLVKLVLFAMLSFFIAAKATDILDNTRLAEPQKIEIGGVEISAIKLWGYLFFQCFLILFTLYTIKKNVGLNGLGGISSSIGAYYNAQKYNLLSYNPGLLKAFQYINISGLCYVIYAAISRFITKKKKNKLYYLNILAGMVVFYLTGTRQNIIMIGFIAAVMFSLIRNAKVGWISMFSFKRLFLIIAGLVAVIGLFNVSVIAMGRTVTGMTSGDLLSTYLGAPLKNLELFLIDGYHNTGAFAGETLIQTYQKLYNATGNSKYDVPSMYTYRWLGDSYTGTGVGLGNVYTLLMPLYYDFGMAGTCLVMALLGILFQRSYDGAVHATTLKNKGGFWSLMIYSYASFSILFSFFSNKIFELVFAVPFLYYIAGIFLFRLYFKRKIEIKYKGDGEEVVHDYHE